MVRYCVGRSFATPPGDPRGRYVVEAVDEFGVLLDEGFAFSDPIVVLFPNGTFDRGSRARLDYGRVDLITAIGLGPLQLRMPVLCMLAEDRRRKPEARWSVSFSRWLVRDRGLLDLSDTNTITLGKKLRGASEEACLEAARDYFRTKFPLPGVDWVPVAFHRSRHRWVRWTANAAMNALERAGFKPGT